jgi:hypothetical protein
MFTSVPGEVALTVSLKIQPADAAATMHRIFPDTCVYRALFPHDIARKPDVHRSQSSHTLGTPPALFGP